MEKIIAALIGLVAGAIGSLIAPWINWGVEKRKIRLQARKNLIECAREYVTSKQFGAVQFSRKTWYAQLIPEMSDEVISIIENFPRNASEGDVVLVREELRKALLLELGRIERKWKLI